MTITIREVEHVANLARLHLSEEEKVLYTEQLSSILAFVDKLNELKTDDIKPTSHSFKLMNVMRDDKVLDMLPRDKALYNSPQSENGMFRVPAIMEGSGGA